MSKRESTRPFTFFFLLLPYGISNGFVSITLPFFLTRAGFSVATAASIVALGVSANVWLFLWGPIVDLSLTPRRWYLLAVVVSAATLFLLGITPFQQSAIAILTAMVFISQIAVTFVVLPMGALMAYTVPDDAKGRAAGWYQAGNRWEWDWRRRRRLARNAFFERTGRTNPFSRNDRRGRCDLFCGRFSSCCRIWFS